MKDWCGYGNCTRNRKGKSPFCRLHIGTVLQKRYGLEKRENVKSVLRRDGVGKGTLLERPRCNGKICFDKRSAVTSRNLRMKKGSIDLRIYPCPSCGYWHLTHLVDDKSGK